MKRFDIELLVRSTLRDYTLTPKRISWFQLLDQLQKQEQKRDQKIIFRKIVLFISVFLVGFSSVRNKSLQYVEIPPLEKSRTVIPTSDIEVEKGDKASLVARNTVSTSKNEQVAVQEKVPQQDELSDKIKSAALEVLPANKRSPEDLHISPGIKVTDAEIESLLQKARENIEMKRILLKQQEILPAQEFLVDAIDIEEEIEPKGTNTEVAFNIYLREFLKIKSVFAN